MQVEKALINDRLHVPKVSWKFQILTIFNFQFLISNFQFLIFNLQFSVFGFQFLIQFSFLEFLYF